jgi:hypothetical protein
VAVAYLVEEDSERTNSTSHPKDDLANKNPKLFMFQSSEKLDTTDETIEKESLKKSVQFWRRVVIIIALVVFTIIVFSTMAATMKKSSSTSNNDAVNFLNSSNSNVPSGTKPGSSDPKKSTSKKNNSNRVLLIENSPDGRVKQQRNKLKIKANTRIYSKGSATKHLSGSLTTFSQIDPRSVVNGLVSHGQHQMLPTKKKYVQH